MFMVTVSAAAVVLAACSSSTKASSTAPVTTAAPATSGGTSTTGAPSRSDADVTLGAATIPGVGTVLVDGNGRTLYILASERGGKVNCTAAGGCTRIWPAVVLPSGMAHGIAGRGVQPSLLATVTGPAGEVRLTYGGWPLYTFVGDTRPGLAKGQALKDAFGLWLVLSPSGEPITTPAPAPVTTTTTIPESGGAGF